MIRVSLFAIILSALFLPSARAVDRMSYFDYGFSAGKNDYIVNILELGVGLDHRWSLFWKLTHTRFDENTSTTEGMVGTDWIVVPETEKELRLHTYGLYRGEPNDVKAMGVGLGGVWALSSLWKSEERRTLLSLDLEFTQYNQRSEPSPGLDLGKFVRQKSFGVGMVQEFSEIWAAGLSFSRSHYGSAVDQEHFLTSVNRRRWSSLGNRNFATLMDGFPQSSVAVEGFWTPTEIWELSLTLASSKAITVPVRTRSVTLDTHLRFSEHWKAGWMLSGVRDSKNQIAAWWDCPCVMSGDL